jgi:phage shock protein A
MNLFTRFLTVAKADAHGVVDALEDKALLLRQHVREAGAELERKRSLLAALDVEEKDLEAASAAVSAKKAALDSDVNLALQEEKDELARFAIKKLLPLSERLGSIDRRRQTLIQERAELQEELTRQEAEYDELKDRVRGYLARGGLGESFSAAAEGYSPVVAEEEVELELLRRKTASAPATAKGGG